jgi:Domain of unknown function (DUF4111)
VASAAEDAKTKQTMPSGQNRVLTWADRISPGEPLHEVEASRYYVLNWAAALQADQPIAGAAPTTVLPAIDRRLIHQVVLQHLRAWPEWVSDMQATGAQAYVVLTLCRAAETLATGRLVSKLAAANAGRSRFPQWSTLIAWAQDWWYHGGSDFDHGRFEDVPPPKSFPKPSSSTAVLRKLWT